MPPSDSAGPAEFSIPFPLDKKPTFYDKEAEIMKLKDGRTALAFKAENAVDMETGAIVAVTTHGGAAADTATIQETVIEAAIGVAELIGEPTPEGECSVHLDGVQEVVADKGYHSNEGRVWSGQVGTPNLLCRARSRPSELARQGGGEGCGIRQPAADSGQSRQESAAAPGRADREELRTSV